MNDRFVKIGEASKMLGVNPQTLRRWEDGGFIQPAKRTPKGTRLYSVQQLLGAKDMQYPTVAYARVSSRDQKEDLERQHVVLESYCNKNGWQTEIIRDLGSGMNYKKKGLLRLLELIVHGQVSRLVITHKDRLLRFGAELIFRICELKGIEVVIINKGEQPSFEEELTRDVMEVMTVFCAKLYGRRSHKSKKMAEAIQEIVQDEELNQHWSLILETRTQQIELKLNNKQKTLFAQHCGYARVAYNFALSSFKTGLDKDEWRSHIDIKREFNAVKYEKFGWCSDLSQNASKNAIHNLGDAVQRWKTKQNRFPVYKKRSDRISYQADNGTNSVEVYKKHIKLPKIGWVKMREELRWTGDIGKVVISKRNGKWFASINVRCDVHNYKHQAPLFSNKQSIGIDVGINTLATCSDGVKYDNPRPLKSYEKKLKRANRRLSRRQKGSQNWHKAKHLLQSVHYRIACIREDAHHKATTDIVQRASAIGIETLKITNMLKNSKLAKALSDSALGSFLVKLKYKAERRGIPITEADQFYASSKTCSSCGYKKKDLTLSERTYHCSQCGISIDRDINAAINLCPT